MKNDRLANNILKKQFLPNLASNFFLLFVQGLSTLIITPFLIRRLDLELFGLVMLFTTVNNYLLIFTNAANNAAGRDLLLHVKNNDLLKARQTFNSYFFGIIVIIAGLIPLIILLNAYLWDIFNIPQSAGKSANLLFMLLILAGLLNFVRSAFGVPLWTLNRFDIRNINQITYFLLRLGLIIGLFVLFHPDLILIGLAYVLAGMVYLLIEFYASRRLLPEVKVSYEYFSWKELKNIWATSFWLTVNQLGSFLFFKAGLILTNLLLDSKQTGKFGAILQIVFLVQSIGFSIGMIITPSFVNLFGEDNREKLLRKTLQAYKLIALVMIYVVALLSGLGRQLLTLWLGREFSDLSLMLGLLLFSVFLEMVNRPLYSLFLAYKKVKVPAIATLLFGVLNILLAVLFVKLNFGLLGIALAMLIALNLRAIFFSPVYSARIQRIEWSFYLKRALLILCLAIAASVLIATFFSLLHLQSWLSLFFGWAIGSVAYLFCAYRFVLNRSDRKLIYEMIPFEGLQKRLASILLR